MKQIMPEIIFKQLALLVFILFFIESSAQTHLNSADIHHYNLNLDMTESLSGNISGHAELHLSLINPSDEFIQLDLQELTIDSIIIDNNLLSYTSTNSTFRFNYELGSDTAIVNIYYHGRPVKDNSWGGFFYDSQMAYNIGVGMSSYPHGIGRFWYPCNDSFTDRATYDFKIKTRQSEMAIASGLLISDSTSGDYNYYHWHLAQTTPTYLTSIVVGNFIKITDTYQGIEKDIPIELYAIKKDSSATLVTFNKLKETLAAFEKRFGVYRWDKIGYSMVSFGSGAMEHVTNIAYPQNQLNDNIGARTLVAHELAHHWFGNLVTCSHSTDMWLNEGWASYCESIFKEEVYGAESGIYHTLANHVSVIKSAHKADGGYFALNDIPQSITYGSTVYDKGALVVHNLRSYLGDDTFFFGVKQFLDENKYSSISSDYLQKELSKITGVNLEPFFNNWVYQPGFPHYSVNYYTVTQNEDAYNIEIELQQKLKARDNYSELNNVPLRFIGESDIVLDTILFFSDKTELKNVELPFYPLAVITDPNNLVLDPITNDIHTITELGYTTFANCDFKIKTNSIKEKVILNAQYNWIEADDFAPAINGLNMSNYHYWKLEGFIPNDYEGEGKFSYSFSTNTNPETEYTPSENDTLVLVYRKDARSNWMLIEKIQSASIKTGYVWTKHVKVGEYALAFWDGQTTIGLNEKTNNLSPNIFPNPSKDQITLSFQNPLNGKVEITDSSGKLYLEKAINNEHEFTLSTQGMPAGILFVNTYGNFASSSKIIKVK